MNNIVAITSTVPVEIIYAAGRVPVDVNNLFITAADPNRLVRRAKMDGFPDTTCSWICGLYGAIMERGIDTVVGVTGGDCSETLALMEVLSLKGAAVIPFSYPPERSREALQAGLATLANRMGTNLDRAADWKRKLDRVRIRIHRLDELLWLEDRASGEEVHLLQLSASDFEGNPDAFIKKVNDKIAEAEKSAPFPSVLRLGYVGVPPIIGDLYERLERDGARVVYNEVQRQFSLPEGGRDLAEAYTRYTYPYGIYARLEDIEREIRARKIDGIIHYIQSFCFRGIEDIVLRRLPVPVLTLQGDLPSRVTETMEVRIEAFLDMLTRRKGNTP